MADYQKACQELQKMIQQKLSSGNDISVESARITRVEYLALFGDIVETLPKTNTSMIKG